jgi:hypothetical protein
MEPNMSDKVPVNEVTSGAEDAASTGTPPAAPAPAPGTPPTPPKRSPGHRGQDVRDTVAEMAARAHEISLEAGSKMASAMKEVIGAAAGLTGFAIESARDLVQYMVRRGQMTQDEADKLIREAEDAHVKRGGSRLPPTPPPKVVVAKPTPAPVAPGKVEPAPRVEVAVAKPVVKHAPPPAPAPAKKVAASAPKKAAKAPHKPASRSASVKAAAKPSSKAAAKPAPKKPKR